MGLGRMWPAGWGIAAFAMAAGTLAAQSPVAGESAIVAADLTEHVRALSPDSMASRTTPSPQLERVATYVAAQLKALGVQPWDGWAETRGWVQRYCIPGQLRLDHANTQVTFTTVQRGASRRVPSGASRDTSVSVAVNLLTAARLARGVGPQVLVQKQPPAADPLGGGGTQTVLVAGRQVVSALDTANLPEKVVLYVPPPPTALTTAADSASQGAVLQRLYGASRGVVILAAEDSARFSASVAEARGVTVPLVDNYMQEVLGLRRWFWAVEVWPKALDPFLSAAGIDLAKYRADPTPVIRNLPSTAIWFEAGVDSTHVVATAPNVVGLLRGTDSTLNGQFLLIAAAMDGGTGSGVAGDATARRDVSGIVGLLALAKAFSRPEARPKRSIIFLATSGTAGGNNWGSNAYVEPLLTHWIDLDVIVASLNLGGLGISAGDSVWVDGGRELKLAQPVNLVAAVHPELGLVVVDSSTVVSPGRDAFTFVRNGIPSLAMHGRLGQVPPMALDPEYEARTLRLAFYLAQGLVNVPALPRWTLEGRDRFLKLLGP